MRASLYIKNTAYISAEKFSSIIDILDSDKAKKIIWIFMLLAFLYFTPVTISIMTR